MRKVKMLLLGIVTMTIMSTGVSIKAKTVNPYNEIKGVSQDLLETFPDLKENLENRGGVDVLNSEDVYLRVEETEESKLEKSSEPKDESDYEFTEVSFEEYNMAKTLHEMEQNPIQIRSGDYIDNETNGNNYIHLNLVLMSDPSAPHKYIGLHEYSWLKIPNFAFDDVVGIAVDANMRIEYRSLLSQSAVYSSSQGTTTVTNNTDISHTPLGAAAKFDLKMGASLSQWGYMMGDIEFNNPSSTPQSANLYGTYVHTKVGFSGSVSIGPDGMPNLAWNLVEKNWSYPVGVHYPKQFSQN